MEFYVMTDYNISPPERYTNLSQKHNYINFFIQNKIIEKENTWFDSRQEDPINGPYWVLV